MAKLKYSGIIGAAAEAVKHPIDENNVAVGHCSKEGIIPIVEQVEDAVFSALPAAQKQKDRQQVVQNREDEPEGV